MLNSEVIFNLLKGARIPSVHAIEPSLNVARQRGADIGIVLDRRADIASLTKDYVAQPRQHLLKDLGGLGRADLNHAAIDRTTCMEHGLAQKDVSLFLVKVLLAHFGLDNLAGTRR